MLIRLFKGCIAAVGFMLLVSGCAGKTVPLLQKSEVVGPQWPPLPSRGKIEWVKSVTVPRDAGIARNVWSRALDFFTGSEDARIVKPHGVYYDAAGRLFVADSGAGVVHVMDTAKGEYSRITGPPGSPFRSPIALTEDDRGGLFITDSASDTIYRYDLVTAEVTPFFRDVARPTGIAFNRVNKLLYVAETGQGRVVAVDGAGKQKLTIDAAKGGDGFFNKPVDLATDQKGRIYVNDPLNYKINIFSPEGALLSRFGEMGDALGELDKPKGIAVDSLGRIYVCDALLDAVQLFDETGRHLLSFGNNGTKAGEFWMPSGIYIHNDHVFVSDTYNSRVQIFKVLPRDERVEEEDDLAAPDTGTR